MTIRATAAVILSFAWLALHPGAAHGWTQKLMISATVHGHAFDKIEITNQDCALEVKLGFDAPPAAYEGKSAVRNYYRFRARVELADHVVRSGVFSNDRPGRRSIRYIHDTSGEGCWAKQVQKLRLVHIEGCRNRNCRVPVLE
jgi:hypothetical protein